MPILSYLLNVVYFSLLLLASPWLMYRAMVQGKYRAGWGAKLLGTIPSPQAGSPLQGNRPRIWLHAVSVGEVNLLSPLLQRLAIKYPGYELVISTTTQTGHDVAKARYGEYLVFYCPLDFTWSTQRAMRRIRPSVLVLSELELWPNLILAAKASGAAVALINGRLSDKSFRGYRRIRPLVGWILRRIDLIATQSDEYARRFLQLGAKPEAVHVTGSMKYDGVESDRQNAKTLELARLTLWSGQQPVFVAGSTGEGEEQICLSVYTKLLVDFPNLRLALVPRHPERFEQVAQLLKGLPYSWQRRSELNGLSSPPNPQIVLVDQMGELAAWWGLANVAFVGGSFCNRGGQNMIEPAAFGAAVCFGPNTWNFREIVQTMNACAAAKVVDTPESLYAFVHQCLENPEFARTMGQLARNLVLRHQGATERTLELLAALVGKASNNDIPTSRAA